METPTVQLEMIRKAAVKVDRHIYEDYRHSELMKHISKTVRDCKEVVQGFITTQGRFVDREEAARIALASGQVKELRYSDRWLFTADLY